jgi:hypothetical protein
VFFLTKFRKNHVLFKDKNIEIFVSKKLIGFFFKKKMRNFKNSIFNFKIFYLKHEKKF